jgi:glycosyltransferase involved in cell wall biosynthesis
MRVKKILLIAHNFPPLISPQSLRWFYLSRELVKRGYKIDVLTIRMPDRFVDLLDMIPEGLQAYRTFPGPFFYSTFKYARKSPAGEGVKIPPKPSPLWRMLSRIRSQIDKNLNMLLVPDIYSEWLPFALKKGQRLVKEKRYDILISSSEARVCHLIGYFLKKKSGTPWIADYGDPWIYPVTTFYEPDLKKKIVEKIERKLLKRMDAITVAADGMRELYKERYPFLAEKRISVIAQGYDPDIFSQVQAQIPSRFRVVYCGSFYKNLRDPIPFMRAIEGLDKKDIEVIIAGRIHEFADTLKKEFKNGMITYQGFLEHRESLSLQKGANVLLNIGNVTDIQVPGKIYEYIGARRPILCLKGNDRDPSAGIIMRYNRGIVAENRKEDIQEGVTKLYELWQKNVLDTHFNLDEIEEFTWRRRAEAVSDLIQTL